MTAAPEGVLTAIEAHATHRASIAAVSSGDVQCVLSLHQSLAPIAQYRLAGHPRYGRLAPTDRPRLLDALLFGDAELEVR